METEKYCEHCDKVLTKENQNDFKCEYLCDDCMYSIVDRDPVETWGWLEGDYREDAYDKNDYKRYR